VVDFGNFLAGPLAPMLMADMGADVVKLEATTGDMMRPTEFAFYGCQRNKRGIAVDMKNPASRPIVERLVRQADAVHHNLRMPAAKKLGIDYETLHALNPRLVYSHVSSYGPIGPRKDWPGFDQLFQASSGWEYEGAGEGNQPIWHRFGMMDHQAAMSSLYALMLGLIERERTGEGQFVAASLLGASILTTSETLVLPNGELAPYPQLDAMQMGVAENRRIFRTADGWLALSTDARGLAKFAEAVGAGRGEGGDRAGSEVLQLVGADVVGVPRCRRHLCAGGQPPDPAPGAHGELPHPCRLRRDTPRRRREELGRRHPRGLRRRDAAAGADGYAVPQRRQPNPVRHL